MNSKFETFHVSTIGASHIKDEKVCQDFALSGIGRDYALAIVADGHGGNKYFRSDRGSKLATENTDLAIREFMESWQEKKQHGGKKVDTILSNPDAFLQQLSSNIIYRWREAIEQDFKNEPFTEKEKALLSPNELTASETPEGWVTAYGTTLIAVVRAKDFWFGLHIGDGKCVSVNPAGDYEQLIPWDEKCFLNRTTSLCDEQALSRFRHYFSKEQLPIAIFVGTDGVDDTFGTDDALADFYKTLFQLFTEKGMTEGRMELQNYLPQLSEKGSRDDVSIAGIIVKKELYRKE